MSAIAERGRFGLFAPAPGHAASFLDLVRQRQKFGAFVGTVAKRLIGRFLAGTPVILAGLHLFDIRGILLITHFSLQKR
jgi:hypothetical protein